MSGAALSAGVLRADAAVVAETVGNVIYPAAFFAAGYSVVAAAGGLTSPGAVASTGLAGGSLVGLELSPTAPVERTAVIGWTDRTVTIGAYPDRTVVVTTPDQDNQLDRVA